MGGGRWDGGVEGVGTAFLSAGDLLVGAGKGKPLLSRDWALGPKGPIDGQCEISVCVGRVKEGTLIIRIPLPPQFILAISKVATHLETSGSIRLSQQSTV